MDVANYRNYSINVMDNVVIRLDTNFKTLVTSTNSLREDEYINRIVDEIREKVPNRDIEISEDKVITIRMGLLFHKPAISIRFFDLNDYNNPKPDYTKDLTDGLFVKIEKTLDQYIDDINNAGIKFVTFENEQYIQIFDNKLYGYFFDLNTFKYVEPPKVILNNLQITSIKDPVRERIETFLRA